MIQYGKVRLFLIVFSISLVAKGQAPEQPLPLLDVLQNLESTYNCGFTFKDADIRDHYAQIPPAANLEQALRWLDQNTLFEFIRLRNQTVAITLKKTVRSGCIELLNTGGLPKDTPIRVRTSYQQIQTTPGSRLSIAIAGTEHPITIEGTGIDPIQLPSGRIPVSGCYTVSLFSDLEYLETVTLTNYIAKGITKNRDGSLNVNYDRFDILPGLIEPDVLLTIQALPGIQSVNETVSFLNIRGGTNDQNLILWDGVKMYQSGHFFGQISAFNPFLTSEVDLIKNGSSARYGDGVSGVISMKGNNEVQSEVSGGAGLNLISGDAFLNLPLGSSATLQLAGRKSYNNLVETPTYGAYFDKAFQNTEVVSSNSLVNASDDDFSFYDAHLRLLYEPSAKDFIRLNLVALGNNLDFLENARLAEGDISRQSELAQNNLSGGLYYRRNWSPKLHTEVQLYGTSYGLSAINFDILANQRLRQENDLLESGIKVHASYRLSEVLQLMGGYQFNETGITNFEQINDPFFERTDKQVLRTNSLYSEAVWQPGKLDARLTGGLRLNYISKIQEFLVEPRLNFNLRLLKNLSLDLAGEIKSQTTSQVIDLQNDFLGVENRRWVLSNGGDIPVLMGRQVSAGLNFAKSGWLVNVESYLREVEGITSQSQGFQNQFENARVPGRYWVKGVDVLLNKRFRNINTWLSYSYAENNYDFPELHPLEFPNNIDIRHNLTFGINYEWRRFDLSAGFNWHSGKPYTDLVRGTEVAQGSLNFSAPNSNNIDDYIRVDLSATYSFPLSDTVSAFCGVSFWNLMDSWNEINRFYRLDSDGAPETVREQALRFTPNATFRVRF